MSEVVKVQVPITSNAAEPLPLVYDKARVHYSMQRVSHDTMKAMNGDLKAFFEAEWNGNEWIIGKRLVDRTDF